MGKRTGILDTLKVQSAGAPTGHPSHTDIIACLKSHINEKETIYLGIDTDVIVGVHWVDDNNAYVFRNSYSGHKLSIANAFSGVYEDNRYLKIKELTYLDKNNYKAEIDQFFNTQGPLENTSIDFQEVTTESIERIFGAVYLKDILSTEQISACRKLYNKNIPQTLGDLYRLLATGLWGSHPKQWLEKQIELNEFMHSEKPIKVEENVFKDFKVLPGYPKPLFEKETVQQVTEEVIEQITAPESDINTAEDTKENSEDSRTESPEVHDAGAEEREEKEEVDPLLRPLDAKPPYPTWVHDSGKSVFFDTATDPLDKALLEAVTEVYRSPQNFTYTDTGTQYNVVLETGESITFLKSFIGKITFDPA